MALFRSCDPHTKSKLTQSFCLSLSIGGNLGIKVEGADFFSTITEGTAGVSGSYSKTASETEARENREGESLSCGYQVVDTLKVPPKTKVEAMITTWAVTYESTTTTEIIPWI